VEELRKSKLLLDGHVLTADHYAGQPEADMEDLAGATTYSELVNKTYALPASDKVAPPPAGAPVRIVKYVEEHFRTVKADVPEFDHFTPSSHLIEKRTSLLKSLPDVGAALDRFEKLFTDLNGLIPPGGLSRGEGVSVGSWPTPVSRGRLLFHCDTHAHFLRRVACHHELHSLCEHRAEAVLRRHGRCHVPNTRSALGEFLVSLIVVELSRGGCFQPLFDDVFVGSFQLGSYVRFRLARVSKGPHRLSLCLPYSKQEYRDGEKGVAQHGLYLCLLL
jgi:hypothetical protein